MHQGFIGAIVTGKVFFVVAEKRKGLFFQNSLSSSRYALGILNDSFSFPWIFFLFLDFLSWKGKDYSASSLHDGLSKLRDPIKEWNVAKVACFTFCILETAKSSWFWHSRKASLTAIHTILKVQFLSIKYILFKPILKMLDLNLWYFDKKYSVLGFEPMIFCQKVVIFGIWT